MIGNGLEKGFSFIWMIVKLNLQFLAFSLLGGIFLGIGPAFQTLSDQIHQIPLDERAQTWVFAFDRWKQNFASSNRHFYLVLSIMIVLWYNLYLSSQLQGLIWLMIDFLLLFTSCLLLVFYLYLLMNQSVYDMSFVNLIKLSFVRMFLNFGLFLKIMFGLIGIILFTWQAKGLLVFGSFSLSLLWMYLATKKNQAWLDGKLFHEN